MSKFKVGDTVFDLSKGFGVVTDTNGTSIFKINVKFIQSSDSIDEWYTEAGRGRSYHVHPTLLTVEEAAKLGYFPEKKKVKQKMYAFLTDPYGKKFSIIQYHADENAETQRVPSMDIEIEVEE